VFDPSGVENWLKANDPGAGAAETVTQLCNTIFGTEGCSWQVGDALGGYLLQAYNGGVPSGGYNLEILSPDQNNGAVCPAEKNCAAQEFVAVSVPEGGAALAYLLLAGLCYFGAIRMRSHRQIGGISAA